MNRECLNIFGAVLKLNSVFVGTLLLCSFFSPRYSSPLYSSPLFIIFLILYYSDLSLPLLTLSANDVYVTTHVYI